MPDRYVAKALDSRRVDQAFPVVQTRYPKLGIDQWRAFAAEMVDGEADGKNIVAMRTARPVGIVVAQIGHGYIHGLFAFQVVHDLSHGRTLQVDLFIALNLFDPVSVADALLQEMERVARQHRCDAIHLSLPEKPDPAQMTRIEEFGHHLEGIRLCKSLVRVAAE